ncbi:MAG TPA: hydantoinase/oxoprolinase family protein [Xanthobacteraceae bacterium]|nr:hydantoinase/oxoprolinase family protein [Xanthobacteraceae bacterium]
MRVGIEIGGTFTDLVAVLPDGTLETWKVPSTPAAPAEAARDAIVEWRGSAAGIETLVHGSTVATNAVIERKGARTCLLVTRGHRDVLEIQRHDKSDIFNLRYEKPVPIVRREAVFEIEERLDAAGQVVTPLNIDDDLLAKVKSFVESGGRSVALCLLHAYVNPEHERALAKAVASVAPQASLSLSSVVNPEQREYERASTTVLSAYLRPIVDRYVSAFEQQMRQHGFAGEVQVMQSSGGTIPIAAAREQSVRVVLSGPAAGVVGAAHMAALSGYEDLVTLDMGGTSADVCLVRGGQPSLSFESRVDGLPIRVPTFDIEVVGAGGGSIAWIDRAGLLQVGPESAGASPGPCCYGRGGTLPTTTDANVLLGLLRPKRFFGGRMELKTDLAAAAVSDLADKLGLSMLDCAEGIRRIADANMIETIRLVSVARGHDPRDFALLAFGGAGGLHACDLAADLGIKTVLVPEHQGVLSALGLLVSDLTVDLVRSRLHPLDESAIAIIAAMVSELADEAKAELSRYSVASEGVAIEASLDLRYVGQASELNLPLGRPTPLSGGSAGLIDRFHKDYRQRYGHSFPAKPVELVSVRLRARRRTPPLQLPPKTPSGKPSADTERIYHAGQWRDAQFLWRPELGDGFTADGPVIVEDLHGTTFVPPGWSMRVDRFGMLTIERRP